MAKSPMDLFREKLFYSDQFREKWNQYLRAFGDDLEMIFGDNYECKIRLSAGLELLLSRRYNDALGKIQSLEAECRTDSDREIICRLITACCNSEQMSQANVGDWLEKSGDGYYLVVGRDEQHAVIKRAFDSELVYVKDRDIPGNYDIRITDLRAFCFPHSDVLARIGEYFSLHPGEKERLMRCTYRMLDIRDRILDAGFSEAGYDYRQFHFYRYTSDGVAFVLNAADIGEYISVTYGFTCVSDSGAFADYGEDDEDILLRYRTNIGCAEDESTAESEIRALLRSYGGSSREDIIAARESRREQFLSRIGKKLEPLGASSYGKRWTIPLSGDICLELEALLSSYSDAYYLNISIYNARLQYPQCYFTRLTVGERELLDWQLVSDSEIDTLIDDAVGRIIMPIIDTPLCELGDRRDIWLGCGCNRERCSDCWVKKNMWEAN